MARQVGRVLLGISDPGKDLVGQDVLAELGYFATDLADNITREEDCEWR